MRTFRDAIDAHAAARPDAPCVIAPEPEAVLTYGDLARIGAELGAFLAQQGIAPGSVVSFMLLSPIRSVVRHGRTGGGGFRKQTNAKLSLPSDPA